MAKSHKSSTLPPNFLLQAQPMAGEENEGFFSKLKKRFKFKKARYNVDLNTGECENVSVVSFKKRESAEIVEPDESPLKYMIGRASERPTRSASPKSKPASRTTSERVGSSKKELYQKQIVNKDAEQDIKTGPKKSKQPAKEGTKGNEYSSIKFDREDPVLIRPVYLANEPKVKNECLLNDDSAIDLDGYDVDSGFDVKAPSRVEKSSSQTTETVPFSSYIIDSSAEEKSKIDSIEEPGYASVNDVKKSAPVKKQSSVDTENDFDPNYESVKDVKDKIRSQGFDQRISKSMESLDDPNYQSINDVKRKKDELFGSNGGQKPRKTYSMFESIESLDEPGYESLNDVKKKITALNLTKKEEAATEEVSKESTVETNKGTSELDDSAVGLSVVSDSINVAMSDEAGCSVNVCASTELTDSSKSKDSGFESKTSPDQESPENLYSKVRKRSEEPEGAPAAQKDATDAGKAESKDGKREEFDSDVELSMDPGYAECADAIKGFPPLSVYSDGSGSKMSSCNSLDLSAEDFVTEPGYAECADAIKTGVIKKISVSNERLVDAAKVKRYSVDEATLRKGVSADIYANPQILFRKRSKLLDERNSGEFTGSSESLMSNTSAKSKEVEVKKEETPILEAPPLPARNYSLYLDNEEADKIVPSPEDLDKVDGKVLEDIDDAFEEVEEENTEKRASSGSKIDVDAILLMENELKDELRNEPVLKTPDDVDEVTKSIESKFPDTVTIQGDLPSGISEDEELCRGIESISGFADEEKCDSSEFIVKVPDIDHGGTKVIKISEKQESVHIQEKRRSVKQSCATKSMDEVSGDSNCGSISSTNCDVKICDIDTDKSETVKDDSENIKQDTNIDDSELSAKDTGIELSAYQLNSEKNTSENEPTSIDSVIPITDSKIDVINEDADCRTRLKEESDKSKQKSSNEIDKSQPHSNNIPSNIPVYSEQVSLTETPPRIISMSAFDSDEDSETSEPLPKLEIIEGEWENVFEQNTGFNNNVGKDIKDEKDQDSKEDTNKDIDMVDSANDTLDSVNDSETTDEVDVFDDSVEAEAASVQSCSVNLTEMSAVDKKATLETKLCVVDSGDSVQDKVVSDLIPANDSEDRTEHILVCDENLNTVSPESSEESETSPQETTPRLCELASYSDMIPNLYNDTEPTHMSLREIMTLSGSDLSSFQSADMDSSLDRSADTSPRVGSFSASNIPMSTDAPPPRPPSMAAHRPNKLTPTDEVPPPYRLPGEEAQLGHAGEGPPPAIPPRSKIRKQTRPVSASQDFMESMRQLKDCGWYWGPLSWEEAEQKLANKPEGTFLVRDSSDERYILSLSFKNQGRVHHTRIEHHKGHFSFWSQPDSHGKSTIKEFIEQCVNNSRNGRFLYFIRPSGPGSPPMPIHLLHPVSRFVQMRSLQHMCRFRILQMVRRDHIDELPVPTRIKLYLKEAQYYVEYLDD